MAITKPSIRIIKTFPYRGGIKEWSNRYYFSGGIPGSSDLWHDLLDAFVANESLLHTSTVTITEALGYVAPSDVAVASKAYTTAGVLGGPGAPVPGDCAVVLRMATTKRSIKNHPVYVFSYFHRALRKSDDGVGDLVDPTMKTAVQTWGDSLLNGITAGGVTAKRTTPDGAATTGRFVEPYIGHRDFPG